MDTHVVSYRISELIRFFMAPDWTKILGSKSKARIGFASGGFGKTPDPHTSNICTYNTSLLWLFVINVLNFVYKTFRKRKNVFGQSKLIKSLNFCYLMTSTLEVSHFKGSVDIMCGNRKWFGDILKPLTNP